MKKIFYITITLFILFSISVNVKADPQVKYTWTSVEHKTVLIPTLNNEVDEYKWIILGKRNSYSSETEWIDYEDRRNHISMLETGTYFITLTGRNTTNGLTSSFTNAVKVSVKEKYIEPSEEEEEIEIGSMIINNLPEPLKSFFKNRSQGEIMLIILGLFLLMFLITKRKKVNKYIKLERFYER